MDKEINKEELLAEETFEEVVESNEVENHEETVEEIIQSEDHEETIEVVEDESLDEDNESDDSEIKEDQEDLDEFSITEEDYNKTIQSTRNRAQTELLKDLGFTSVKEFNDFKNELISKASEVDEVKVELENSKNSLASIKEERLFEKLGVKPEYIEDLKVLAKAKDGEFEETVKELVSDKYSHMLKDHEGNKVKIGLINSEEPIKESSVSNSLKSKFPWL